MIEEKKDFVPQYTSNKTILDFSIPDNISSIPINLNNNLMASNTFNVTNKLQKIIEELLKIETIIQNDNTVLTPHNLELITQMNKVMVNIVPKKNCIKCTENVVDFKLNCGHEFCNSCMEELIIFRYTEASVKCPIINNGIPCKGLIDDTLVNEIQSGMFKNMENIGENLKNMIYCMKFPECQGKWMQNNEDSYTCDLCKSENCFKCNTIHSNYTCKEFKDKELNITNNNIKPVVICQKCLLSDSTKTMKVKKCGHSFCIQCITNIVMDSDTDISCPYSYDTCLEVIKVGNYYLIYLYNNIL